MITNMYIANDSLPNETKARIERSTATHLWGWNTGGGTSTLNTGHNRRTVMLFTL